MTSSEIIVLFYQNCFKFDFCLNMYFLLKKQLVSLNYFFIVIKIWVKTFFNDIVAYQKQGINLPPLPPKKTRLFYFVLKEGARGKGAWGCRPDRKDKGDSNCQSINYEIFSQKLSTADSGCAFS